MSKQKFIVFLIAIIGMIATFLPWYEIGDYGMIIGYQSAGWFTFVMFALVFLFALRKEAKRDMSMGLLYLGSFFSLLAAFVVLWRSSRWGWIKKGELCRLLVTHLLMILVFYTGRTKLLLLESVYRLVRFFFETEKKDKEQTNYFSAESLFFRDAPF